MKVHSSLSPTYEVLMQLEKIGIVPFSEYKTPFVSYYNEKLNPLLNESIIQDYTNHPSEGYYYFLYDSDKFSRQEAINQILKSKIDY
jgi:hypothetical protein